MFVKPDAPSCHWRWSLIDWWCFPFFLFFPCYFAFFLLFLFYFSMCLCHMYVRAYLANSCVTANDNVKHIESNIRYVFYKKIKQIEISVHYIRFHEYEFTERMFTSNLSHRDRMPKYISNLWTKHGSDGKRWPLTPFPFLVTQPSRSPAFETPPRPVPAGFLVPWPKNASCSRIPPRASRTSLPP